MKPRALVPLLLCVLGACAAPAPHAVTGTDAVSARGFVIEFLRAFENLDLPAFVACFDENATAFFPPPEPPSRHDGREAIRARFALVFDGIRRNAPSGPPYHELHAEDLRVDMASADTAIATFHLKNTQRIARRTLVLRYRDGAWHVVHLHASNVPLP